MWLPKGLQNGVIQEKKNGVDEVDKCHNRENRKTQHKKDSLSSPLSPPHPGQTNAAARAAQVCQATSTTSGQQPAETRRAWRSCSQTWRMTCKRGCQRR